MLPVVACTTKSTHILRPSENEDEMESKADYILVRIVLFYLFLSCENLTGVVFGVPFHGLVYMHSWPHMCQSDL